MKEIKKLRGKGERDKGRKEGRKLGRKAARSLVYTYVHIFCTCTYMVCLHTYMFNFFNMYNYALRISKEVTLYL
jgi:hypothetical protein